MTNAKVVMTQLAYKDTKIYFKSLDGGYISAKNPNDPVTMDYINLDINQLNKNKGKLIKLIRDNGDKVVDENKLKLNVPPKKPKQIDKPDNV